MPCSPAGGSPLTTTYHYYPDPNAPGGFSGAPGELAEIIYPDGTPNVAFSYDRLGRRDQVSDAAGIRVFGYDPNTLELLTETIDPNGLLGDILLTQTYQGSGGGLVPGRWSGVKIGEAGDPNQYYTAKYGYDGYGRLNHATGPGLPTGSGVDNGAWYLFLDGADSSNTDLLSRTEFRNSSATVKAWSERAYDPNRDTVDYVANVFGDPNSTDLISKYNYGNDELGRRVSVVYTGAAFAGDHMDLWTYDNRSELTSTTQYTQTDNVNEVIATVEFEYDHRHRLIHETAQKSANPVRRLNTSSHTATTSSATA